jgi:hypothetical protein
MDLLESTTMRENWGDSGGGLRIARLRILMNRVNWIGAGP